MRRPTGPGSSEITRRRYFVDFVVLGGWLVVLVLAGIALGSLVAGPFARVLYRSVDDPLNRYLWIHRHAAGIAQANGVSDIATLPVAGLIAMSAASFFALRRHALEPFLQFGAAFLGAGVITVSVRFAVTRPSEYGHDKGFPSGHVMLAVTVFGMLAVYAADATSSRALRRSAVGVLTLVVMAVAAARLLDHAPSDVFGSIVLGAAWVYAIARHGRRSGRPDRVIDVSTLETRQRHRFGNRGYAGADQQ